MNFSTRQDLQALAIVGAVAPQGLELWVNGNGFDCRLVVSASIEVTRSDGTMITWIPEVLLHSLGSVLLRRIYHSGDLTVAGRYKLLTTLSIVGYTPLITTTADLFVFNPGTV